MGTQVTCYFCPHSDLLTFFAYHCYVCIYLTGCRDSASELPQMNSEILSHDVCSFDATTTTQVDPDTAVDNIPASSDQTVEHTVSNDLSNLLSFNQGSHSPTPGPSGLQQAKASQPFDLTPKDLRPLPQAGPRTVSSRGRKKRKTAILTDTPEKTQLRKNT